MLMNKPKTILLVSQKGGVGKTTIADEILFELDRRGLPFTFYELDDQGGNVHKPVKNSEARFAVVDTPGGLCADTAKWIGASDLVILPVKPSFRDIEPFLRMGAIIRDNLRRDACAFFVINMINARMRATKDFIAWFQAASAENRECFTSDYSWSFGLLLQSEMAVQAPAYGKSVIDYAPKSEIAASMRRLMDNIFTMVGV